MHGMMPGRKPLMIVALLLVVAIVGTILWFYGRPRYRQYKETRAIQAAEEAFAKGDFRAASVAARKALLLNRGNLKACLIMADMCEAGRLPQAIEWRQRIVELSPTSENQIALARVALRFEGPPYPTATQALQKIGDGATNNAIFQVTSAELALRKNQAAEALRHFETAVRLEPGNETHQLNLAVLRLSSPDSEVANGARAALESLKTSTNIGEAALRCLVTDSFQQNDLTTAEQLSNELLAHRNCGFQDRLQHLSVLEKKEVAEQLEEFLAQTQKVASTNAAHIYGLSYWMITHRRPEAAQEWLNGLAESVRAQQPVRMAMIDCFIALKDWSGLEEFLQGQEWKQNEYLRLAFLSTAAHERKESAAAQTRWRSAVRQAGDRLAALESLRKLAQQLGRLEEEEDLLWHIYQRMPAEKWVLRELDRRYSASGNTRGLHRVYTTLERTAPTNAMVQNNLAATSLLLTTNLPKAHELAREVYQRFPDNATIASTFAFSLHQQGRAAEALEVLEKLPADLLEKAPVALYYGIVLLSNSQTNKATQYLDVAAQSELLPEEKKLLTAARGGAASQSQPSK
jgi:predicted Zn-dependent protease